MDLLFPTRLDGFQITQIQIGLQADQSPGYATFIKGERTFTTSYSVTGEEFVIKVNEIFLDSSKYTHGNKLGSTFNYMNTNCWK